MSIEYPKEKAYQVVRHGEVKDLGALIEQNQKPPYEAVVAFMRGESDPLIDREATLAIIERKIAAEELDLSKVNVFVTSETTRARQTGELLAAKAGLEPSAVRALKYFNEIKFPMHGVTQEEYEKAGSFLEVRNKVIDAFFRGEKQDAADEGPVEVYRRALRACEYLKKVTVLAPKAMPLIVTHGFFGRILQIALEHGDEHWSDEEIMQRLSKEFKKVARPGNLGGMNVKVVVDKDQQKFEIVSRI